MLDNKKTNLAWDIEATSGALGCEINKEFLDGLSDKELLYLQNNLIKVALLIQLSIKKRGL